MSIFDKIRSFFIALGLALACLPYLFTPTIEFDLNNISGDVSSRACGYLYGLAQEDVPSAEAVKTLEISSVSQKVYKGLQHPIGDVDDVSARLDSCDYIVVYLQDSYSTWYYAHAEIDEMRRAGTYDCVDFVDNDFLPKVREKVSAVSAKPYSDRIVYCPYNECDNTVWFGSPQPEGWLAFDEAARGRFYDAWKKTYNEIRAINPNALIGGPGYCDYDIFEITDFLGYCKENSCLPDVMIYHELNDKSSLFWQDHVEEYRSEEKALGIDELPIIVTEYGCMFECGAPQYMLHYISSIEKSGTYGNVAYWRLADNLCDTVTNANCPNSCWWLYKWYCDMEGGLIDSQLRDVLHSDFANTIKYARDRFHCAQLDGMGAYDESEKTVSIICGGCDYDFQLALKNVKNKIGGKVRVKVEAVTFEGLTGEVMSPAVIEDCAANASGTLKIKIASPDKEAVYHVTVSAADEEHDELSAMPERFEFESGTLLGTAYTYDSAYATTGDINGMCGGFEKPGDGITLNFTVPEDGDYELSLVYGKANDGRTPADRVSAEALMTLDGSEETVLFKNTIKSEYTDKYTFTRHLGAGAHTITLMHGEGTFVLDSLLVRKNAEAPVYSQYEKEYGEYLVIAPEDGYYEFSSDSSVRYLKKGFNYVETQGENLTVTRAFSEDYAVVSLDSLTLSEGAEIKAVGGRYALGGITSEGGGASFTVNAEKAGKYALTFTYSNNEEGGVHDYNVDIIEEYITVKTGDEETNAWCVNTYSDYRTLTKVVYIDLTAGENEITLYNSGFNRFNSRVATSPYIYAITVNPYVK
ncbi:MAG: hypothetical protein J5562_07525 [Clostridia bacterium]|nr:hypothetical protein [Clostridia bacterium]